MKLIKNRFSRLFVFSFLAVGALFQGCVELEKDGTEFQPPQTLVVENEDDLEALVRGVYNNFLDFAHWSEFYIAAWAGDDVTTWGAGNKADFREFDQRNVQNTNIRLQSVWVTGYDVINRANQALNEAVNIVTITDQARYDRLIGELRFLRGISYLHLTRIFGPLVIQTESIPQTDLFRSTQLKVYQEIEKDLLIAESNLPVLYPDIPYKAVRPNKGSARAFLARLYLDWGGYPVMDASKYTDAAQKASEVIAGHMSHQFRLEDHYRDLWTVYDGVGSNQPSDGRYSEESIFTLVYCVECTGSIWPRPQVANFKFGLVGLPTISLSGSNVATGWSETFGEIRYWQDMPESDRKDATYDLMVAGFDISNAGLGFNQRSPIYAKYSGLATEQPWLQGHETDKPDFLMRYAEVLLIYAEASDRSGFVGTISAQDALSQVQTRAVYGNPADLPSGSFVDQVLEERKWEFAGEGDIRWNDLKRTQRIATALADRDDFTFTLSNGVVHRTDEYNPILGSTDPDSYIHPIPASIIAVNPNIAAPPQ